MYSGIRPIANFFRGLKMIPVFRFRDGLANVKKNAGAFEQTRALLKSKKSILIFPEGNHQASYYLRPLQKGIAGLRSIPKLRRTTALAFSFYRSGSTMNHLKKEDIRQ